MRKVDIKGSVERELANMLDKEGAPDEARVRLVKVAIGYLAVQARVEESEYGGFFTDGDAPPAEAGEEPRTRGRKRGRKPAADDPPADPGGVPDLESGFFDGMEPSAH